VSTQTIEHLGGSTHEAPGGAAGSIHERQRGAILGHIPAWYSPALHLTIPTVLGLTAMIASLFFVHQLQPLELLAVPLTLLLAFGFEWRAHQLVLHRRIPGLGVLYDRHELQHHVVFTYDDLAMRAPRELWLILMPAYAVVLVFLIELPLALLTARLFGTNAGCLFMVTSMAFFLSYEWLHCAYHLPPDSVVGRLGVIARLREHHRRHHDPRLMKRWNFNVTVPVFDWVHRTVWSPAREAEVDARVREAARRRDRAAAHG
jgi:hypothetical protein